jgi:hypothetical protein
VADGDRDARRVDRHGDSLTSASLIPYRYGWCRLHIDGAQVATWEVGTVPGGEYDANGKAAIKKDADGRAILIPRVITDGDIAELASNVIGALQRYEATEVRFEWPGRRTTHAERIGSVLEVALAEAGIATTRSSRRKRRVEVDSTASSQTTTEEVADEPSRGNAAPGEVDPAGDTRTEPGTADPATP